MLPDNHSVYMTRVSLLDIPQYSLPAGYGLRPYQAGDAAHWVAIHEEADLYNTFNHAMFTKQFGSDHALLAERQFYIIDEQQTPIATASAWFTEDGLVGKVHWVAILPDFQGLGLAKPLITAVLNRLDALGYQRAYLGSGSARLPALNLYLKFGFEPLIRSDEDQHLWDTIYQQLGSAAP